MSNSNISSKAPILLVPLMLLMSACSGGSAPTTTEPTASTVPPATTDTTEPPTTTTGPRPPTTTTTTNAPPWTIPAGSGTEARGLHIGGYGGPNPQGIDDPPDEWFDWLGDMNANWVGISVLLYVTDVADSTVSRVNYSSDSWPTFTDQQLANLIGRLREHGFNVYMSLAFGEAEFLKNPRWAFGNPAPPLWLDKDVDPSGWRWNPDHPEHETFVAEFFDTYTQQAVHFAEIAEEHGVGLFSLGTETPGLFNVVADTRDRVPFVRSEGVPRLAAYPGSGAEYRDELVAMADAVRAVYNGSLTYDQHFSVVQLHGQEWPQDRDQLWEVLDLDVIGLSWYYPLVTEEPTEMLGIAVLEQGWRRIFDSRLETLANRHPERPIMLTEFGYANSIRDPFTPGIDEPKCWEDADGDGVDDGDQSQANSYEAFFNVAAEYPGAVDGVFLWDNSIGTFQEWSAWKWAKTHPTGSVRFDPSATVVREAFGDWRGMVPESPTTDTLKAPASIAPRRMCVDSDTTLEVDHFGNVAIRQDNVTLDCDGHKVSGSGEFGIELIGRTGVTLRNCVVEGFENGFYLEGSNGNFLMGNSALNNAKGFALTQANLNELRDNLSSNNGGVGVSLWESSNNTLIGNTSESNGGFGFWFGGRSSHNAFEENRACDNGDLDAGEPSSSANVGNIFVDNEFCTTVGI